MLAKVHIEGISPIESNFGKGGQIAKAILAGEVKIATFKELYALYDEEAA